MAIADKGGTVTLQELLVTSLAQTDAVAKLLIEKGVFTQAEFLEKIKAERATYQAMLEKMRSNSSPTIINREVIDERIVQRTCD